MPQDEPDGTEGTIGSSLRQMTEQEIDRLQLARRAGLLYQLVQADMIRAAQNENEEGLWAEIRELFPDLR